MQIRNDQIKALFFKKELRFTQVPRGLYLMIAGTQDSSDRFQYGIVAIHEEDSSIFWRDGVLLGRGGVGRRRRLKRKLDEKRRPTRREVTYVNGSPMFRDDSIANAETKTCTLASRVLWCRRDRKPAKHLSRPVRCQ